MQIIRKRAIVEDDFTHVADADELPAAGKPIVSLARYVKERGQLVERYATLGVRMASDKLPTDVPDLERLAMIAIEFPKFTDGCLQRTRPTHLPR